MRKCQNCGTEITCGCQDRTASNGIKVCSNCISFYEQQILNIPPPSKSHNYSPNLDENTST